MVTFAFVMAVNENLTASQTPGGASVLFDAGHQPADSLLVFVVFFF